MLNDMSLDTILQSLQNPWISVAVTIMLVNWLKDQYGLNGKLVPAALVPCGALVAVLQFIGPYAHGPITLSGWGWATAVNVVGAPLVWSGGVKLLLHKLKGTEPTRVAQQRESRVVGPHVDMRKAQREAAAEGGTK